MKRGLRYFVLLTAFTWISAGIAQQHKADSLFGILKSAKNDTAKVNTLTELSRALTLTGKYSRADSAADEAANLATKLNFPKGTGNAYSCKAIISKQRGDFSKSLDYNMNALNIRLAIGDSMGISSSYNNLGIVYDYMGDYPKSLEYYFKAIPLSQRIGDKRGMSAALGNVGEVYREEVDYKKALYYDSCALSIQREVNDKKGTANSLNNMGLIYSNLHNYTRALAYCMNALKIRQELGEKKGIAASCNNIGNLYKDEGDYPLAMEYYTRSLNIKLEIGDKNGIAASYINIAGIYALQKNYKDAIDYSNKAIDIGKDIGSMSVLSEAEKELSETYVNTNEPKLALEHYKAYITTRDSLFNKENTKKIVASEMNFEFEKKQSAEKAAQDEKDALKMAEARKQKLIIYFIGGALLIVIGFIVFAYTSYLQKRRVNKDLDNKNRKLESAYHTIEEKNHEITDSINYARRIQQAMLPAAGEMRKALPQSFVLFKPKDIVSGDFYFFHKAHPRHIGENLGGATQVLPTGEDLGGAVFIAAADCTGHGVPGAFMSMIGSEKLNEAVAISTDTHTILGLLNNGIRSSLHQSENANTTRDGMDIALCALKEKKLQFSGANRPLWVVRKGSTEIEEYKPTKKAIGGFTEADQRFESTEIELNSGDTFYIFTDGYADQFGGTNGKKLTTTKFKELLSSIANKPMDKQHNELDEFIESWKADKEQLDDILIIGVRV